VPQPDRQNIIVKLDTLSEAVKGEDVERIQRASEDLQNAFHALSQQLYAQQQAAPGGNGHHSDNGFKDAQPDDEGDVVEGEFREA
jgi:molecular chaperone DnaK